jgi:Zn-dependent metalloprotease
MPDAILPNAVESKTEAMDKLSAERFHKLVALETAEDAKKIIIEWAKWIAAPFAAVAVILGIATYADIGKRIDKISADAAEKVREETTVSLNAVKKDIDAVRQKARVMEREIEEYRASARSMRDQFEIEMRVAVPAFLEKRIRVKGQRRIFDAKGGRDLSTASLVRSEGGPETNDAAVDKIYEYLGIFRDFLKDVFGRDSYDDRGGDLIAFAHYGKAYNNSFWDGKQILLGDGDGIAFATFVDLAVISGELAHGVTETTAGLIYQGQSGALNTHISDVFGTLVEQWHLRQTVDKASWLVGAGIFPPQAKVKALRSLKDPGSAYDSPILGRDPQPKHMKDYRQLPEDAHNDNGGVHINSGIPNRAFYLAASKIGGFAWEKAGKIWYQTLRSIHAKADFAEFASQTLAEAEKLFGKNSKEWGAVKDAWQEVGVTPKQ